MPNYLVKGRRSVISGARCQPEQPPTTVDCSSAIFFDNLATKLMDMSISIEKQMEELKKKQCAQPQAGFLFASITVPKMTLGIGYEFLEYVTRYGPPPKGKFDPVKLEQLRIELGVQSNTI